jgi:glycosyltransferase involved in cell wall biosynthesis
MERTAKLERYRGAKVTILAGSMLARDAVGNSILDKARFFQSLDCDVKVLYQDVAEPPAELKPLFWQVRYDDLQKPCPAARHFHTSAIYIFDYPHYYKLAEAIRMAESGLVFFDYHGVTPPELWGDVPDVTLMEDSIEGGHLVWHADYAITHSNFTRQELAQRFGFPPERTFVLPLAVDPVHFRPGPVPAAIRNRYRLPNGRMLLYVGRMAGNKRVNVLVQGLARLKGDFPDLHLLLVGDKDSPAYAPFVAATQRTAWELGLKDHVIFTGQVPDVDLPDVYRLADVFVTASLHEGFCVPVLEAMASGVPVVASRATALPETVGEAGLLFAPDDPEDLATQVRRLLTEPSLYQHIAARGLERVTGFTREAYYHRWIEILGQASERGVQRRPKSIAPPKLSLRISLVNGSLPPNDAVGNNLIQKARALRKMGHEVKVFVGSEPIRPPDDLRANVVQVHLADLVGREERTRSHFHRSDVYIYDFPVFYDLAESIRHLSRGLVVFDYHGITPPELWDPEGAKLLQRSKAQVRLVHYADWAIVHSNYARDELATSTQFPSDRITMLPYGVPLKLFTSLERDPQLSHRYGLDGQSVLLYVGRMVANKRIDLLIEALAKVKIERPAVKLLLVGDVSDPANEWVVRDAQALADRLGVTRDVIFTGPIAYADLPRYYNLADVFVTASLHECFCIPVVEAMACSVPVIGSHATALPETIGDAGLTFKAGDAGELAMQMLRVLDDGELRWQLSRAGQERAQSFSLERYEQRWADLLAELIAQFGIPEQRQQVQLTMMNMNGPVSFDKLERRARVLDRTYRVWSDKPLIGPLIAWVRRNMTSHLREPYLDPMMDRQEAFNLEVVQALYALANHIEERAADLERRQDALKERLDQLQRDLEGWREELTQTSDSTNI